MKKELELVRDLVSQNKIPAAVDLLTKLTQDNPDLSNQVLTLSARFNDVRRKENLGLIGGGEASITRNQVNYGLLALVQELIQSDPGLVKSINVFISYNHNDAQTANILKEKLTANGISVTIDSDSMQAGEDIQTFIENSVRDTTATISIVSKSSLLSAWVAMETINTTYHEKTNASKKFIACYLDDDFFERDYTDKALDYIDEELAKINALRQARIEKGRNTRDLNNEYTRLKELSNGLDEIVRRLRESLCIDIRGDKLETNFGKVLATLNTPMADL